MPFYSELRLEDWELLCRQLQKQLTSTYAQFGPLAGCQLVVISIEATGVCPMTGQGERP